jgi:hypothetical protein
MPKLFAGLLAVMMLSAMFAIASQARAEIEYPWCAQYSDISGATNCGFVSRAQCMATVSGIGGFCYENPAYGLARPRPKRNVTPR